MDRLTMALIAGGIQAGSGLLGGAASQGDRDRAYGISQDIYNQYKNLSTPDIEKLKLYLEQFQSVGDLVPESVSNVGELGASALENVSTDPRLREYQTKALQGYDEIATNGMSAVDKAQLEQLLRSSAAQEQANTQSILENRARRGMAGSGDELAAALGGTQAASNRRSMEALNIAAQAAQRREDALAKSSNLAANLEQSDYNRANALAGKRDSISEFNARLRQNLEGTNVANRNNAQEFNLNKNQGLADKNVTQRNSQQQYNKNLIQQDYDNQLKRLNGMSGAGNTAAKAAQDRADATAGMYTGIGNAVAGGLTGYMDRKQAQQKLDNDAFDNEYNKNFKGK